MARDVTRAARPPARRTRRDGPAVVVTGASAGVGRATALALAREGARIGLVARDAEALEDVARAVARAGGEGLVLACDLTDVAAVAAAAERAASAFGGIDVWVNNAMATVFGPVSELSPEEVRRVTEVTYLGTVHGTMAALRHMRRQGHGTIVQVGSALAYRGIPLQAAYCGAKHAIRGFTDALRAELIAERSPVAVTAVHLPGLNTPQFEWARTHMPRQPRPAGPVYQPEAAAEAIVRAIHRPVREYWVGTQSPAMILANMVAPSRVDRLLARSAIAGQMTDEPVRADRRDNLYSPVHALHRTRGAFDREASRRAPALAAPATRIGALVGLVALAAGAAFLASRIEEPEPPAPRLFRRRPTRRALAAKAARRLPSALHEARRRLAR